MNDTLRSPRFRSLVILALIWLAVLYFVEFEVIRRPQLKDESVPASPAETAVPDFNLKNVAFNCAAQTGLVTSVKLEPGGRVLAKCETSLTDATTRCPSGLPVAGYGDLIKCSEGEAVHCHDGPLQTLGLFKDDSFCGDITDRDLGPPQEAARSDD